MRHALALLENVIIPPMIRLREPQGENDAISDVAAAVLDTLEASAIRERVYPGMTVAVGVGSRGVANLPVIVRSVIDWLHGKGAKPFIIPAMGSHGGVDAASQKSLLAEYGVTEERMDCPVRSSMDAVHLASLSDDLEVFCDPYAAEADGIFVINKIKPHNAFRAANESGIVKMLAIGLGKQKGAASCHKYGFERIAERLASVAGYMMQHQNDRGARSVLGGLALVENRNHATCRIEAVPVEDMFARDAALLELAWEKMARLPVDRLDGLILDEMGKNISGSGMDPNVLGRYTVPFLRGGPVINKIAVLRLTPESEGNAIGMGLADCISRRLYDAIDFENVYANALTSTVLFGSRTPCTLPSDRDVVRAVVRTCNGGGPDAIRLIRARSTLHLDILDASPALVPELLEKGWVAQGEATPMDFDAEGNLSGIASLRDA
ncbi:nickel-dependent lactate racemase [Desulfovibrio sp. OttesenSCG-928-I05]|nr:nickel-dependent lactate racemase [Desulfovibrio sp. OttesenSCG-928-I05]